MSSSSNEQRAKIIARDGDRCWFCGSAPLPDECDRVRLDPAGKRTISNLMLSSARCGRQKGGKSLEEFRAYMRRMNHREVATAEQFWNALMDGRAVLSPQEIQYISTLITRLDAAAPKYVFAGELK